MLAPLDRDPALALEPRDVARDAPHPVPAVPSPAAAPSARHHDVRVSESDADNPMICRSID